MTALAAPAVPLAFLVNGIELARPFFRAVMADFGGLVAFVGGIMVGGSVVLALVSGRRFTRSGGRRVTGVLLAAAAPALAVLALVLGRFPWP